MAAALRFAARRLCGRALRGPQARSFMSAARQMMQPDIDSATKFRRLVASESTSFMNRPHGRLAKQVDVTKQVVDVKKSLVGTVAAIVATVYLEAKAIKAWNRRN